MRGAGTLLATIVDTKALWQSVVAAIAAGVGVCFVFSLAVLGSVRLTEMAREGRTGAAVALGVVTTAALAACAAAIVLGVVFMTQK